MNAITQLDVLDLEDTIARYGVGDLIRYWPAVNGIENSNYFLRTTQDGREREFVLTIIEQPSNAGGAYVPLLDLCARDGLPVAEIVRTSTGQPYDKVARDSDRDYFLSAEQAHDYGLIDEVLGSQSEN